VSFVSALANWMRSDPTPPAAPMTLRRLEARALLVRTVFAEVPVRVEYSLTDLGVDAEKPLRALRGWVEANIERFPPAD